LAIALFSKWAIALFMLFFYSIKKWFLNRFFEKSNKKQWAIEQLPNQPFLNDYRFWGKNWAIAPFVKMSEHSFSHFSKRDLLICSIFSQLLFFKERLGDRSFGRSLEKSHCSFEKTDKEQWAIEQLPNTATKQYLAD